MRHVIPILMLLCAGSLASGELNECIAIQKLLQCEYAKGFTYQVPHNMTVYLRDPHCEHGWYHSNGTFIADSTINAYENLTLSTCANIQWHLICDNIQVCWVIYFTAKHQTAHKPLPGNYTLTEDKEDEKSPNWLIGVIVGSVMLVTILAVTIWIFCKKCVRSKYTLTGQGGLETENSKL